jgi:hypothetical protein
MRDLVRPRRPRPERFLSRIASERARPQDRTEQYSRIAQGRAEDESRSEVILDRN